MLTHYAHWPAGRPAGRPRPPHPPPRPVASVLCVSASLRPACVSIHASVRSALALARSAGNSRMRPRHTHDAFMHLLAKTTKTNRLWVCDGRTDAVLDKFSAHRPRITTSMTTNGNVYDYLSSHLFILSQTRGALQCLSVLGAFSPFRRIGPSCPAPFSL